MSLHIAGVFIILAVSGFGMGSSLLLGWKRDKSILLEKGLQLGKMFGIGIIAATAWIHLLPDSFDSFSSPCLDAWWSIYGPNWVGVFGLIAAFGVQLLEMAGHTHVKRISGSHDHAHHHDSHEHSFHEEVVAIPPLDAADKNTDSANNSTEVELPIVLNFIVTPADKDERPVAANCEAHPTKQDLLKGLSTIVLELGILVHSLIIGITLGVSDDSRFKTLSVAICFHQLFEGMALGTLVSDTTLRPRDKVVLGLLYPLTTPMGVAVGIATRQSFNENASHTLLLRGIFNSLSAGILIYNTYCELVGGEINHNPGFERLSKSFKIACFLSMYLGATAMALLGVWA